MIERLEIRNWQSLRAVDLTFGRFAVIVGPSSSGKSALVRALRALASNVSGTAAITRGADTAAITARTDRAIVTLEHARGAWQYRLVDDGREQHYTKLNRAVPEAVTTALGIHPAPAGGASINIAGQFDRPYLLADPRATVARVLGELTNVDTIYAAVQEANRRRASAATLLKGRREDLARLTDEVARFTGLKDRLAACDRAETAARRATELHARVQRLGAATAALDVANAVLARAEELPTVPAIDALAAAQQRMHRFREVIQDIGAAHKAIAEASAAIHAATAAEAHLHGQLHELLVAAGTCPTCQRPIA